MRKTKIITLGILAITAMACDDPPAADVRHCVNADGVVVDEALCAPLDDGGDNVVMDDAGVPVVVQPGSTYYPGNGNVVPYIIMYRWYYGGGRTYTPGTRVFIGGNGYGSFRPSPSRVYSSPGGHTFSSPSIGKGGFGGTGHSFGGGAGE